MRTSTIDKQGFLIDYIRKSRKTSRNEIARRFNLNSATVTNLTERLLDSRVIVEDRDTTAAAPDSAGRPPIILKLNPDAAYFVGVNLNAESLCACLIDFTGRPVSTMTRTFSRPVHKDAVIKSINAVIGELIEKGDVDKNKIEGIGIGVPGTLDNRSGRAISYLRIKKWKDVPIVDIVSPVFSLPVFIEQNSNCFALGEISNGDARQYANIVAIVIRTGIGMGIIHNREVFSFSQISAGELGHVTLNPKGGRCWCGNHGCLETLISGWILPKKIRQALKKANIGPSGIPTDPREFCRLAENGNELAVSVLGGMFEYLGIAITDIFRLIRPDAIVIDGHFNGARSLMREKIGKVMKERLNSGENLPKIIISTSDDTIGACGAALMAVSRLYNPLSSGAFNIQDGKHGNKN
ncbi:MAG: ROK family protein [Victivallales bacterium]